MTATRQPSGTRGNQAATNRPAATGSANMSPGAIRKDLLLIGELIEPGSRVLDIGCGDGNLLLHLTRDRHADARGIEISQQGVNTGVTRGLSIVQGDADTDLVDYPSNAFDYVILSQTLQAMQRPKEVLLEMVRIGRHVIVSLPNFGYWRVRWHLLRRGTMPLTKTLDHAWYETPNIHFCTLTDFVRLCNELEIPIERMFAFNDKGKLLTWARRPSVANLFADQAMFLLHGSLAKV